MKRKPGKWKENQELKMNEKTKVISTLLCRVYGRVEIHTSSTGKIQIQICLWRSTTKHWSLCIVWLHHEIHEFMFALPCCWVRIGADLIARIGVDQELDFILFTSPPVDLAKALEDFCNGVFFNRLCTELDVAF